MRASISCLKSASLPIDSSCVKVVLSDGSTHTYGLLIAAGGHWSKTRNLIFPTQDVTIKHKGMYAAYFTVPRLDTDEDRV
jgi:2-polyprenyl-6-methoxyphenol hydroxylase-like FAD-dependent oxidoreductase